MTSNPFAMFSPVARMRTLYESCKGSKDETFQFARFKGESETELSTIQQNGTLSKRSSVAADDTAISNEAFPSDVKEDPGEDVRLHKDRITEWQAGYNVTNAIQGMFIVTFPYAVLQGGYWALFAMVFVAYICCHTGKILVECLYEEDANGVKQRVRNSYVQIAEDAWGKRFGARIVNIAQFIELLMTCILYVLLCGDLIIGSFPNTKLNLSIWIFLSSLLLLPCAFLKNLRHVSWLSFWCTVAHMFINAIIIIFCLTKAGDWHWSAVQIKIDIWTFPISLGIVVFSYTSQIFLPSLEGNLVNRSKFNCMMHWTHIAAAAFKALFSWIGFLTFGFDTQEVITNNLPTQTFKAIVNLILVIKALLSYPLPYYAAVELLEQAFFRGKPETRLPSCFSGDNSLKFWAIILRLMLVGLTTLFAIVIPHFSILMGLIGSFTGCMLSFVWPCMFHLKLRRQKMSRLAIIGDVIIILLGVIFGLVGMYYSGAALIRAFQGESVRPFQGHLALNVTNRGPTDFGQQPDVLVKPKLESAIVEH
ncbi:unnamed protein product [Owenia fusiformis]|uniref:Vesicular inhibitory amino acid transporter n=1 Tax=Owenia fusiformis TaxID=6347 RepID=A0A8S4N1Y5_OWEFU|nr:unnamed protein product [Owenia fusiformis]